MQKVAIVKYEPVTDSYSQDIEGHTTQLICDLSVVAVTFVAVAIVARVDYIHQRQGETARS